LLLAALVLAGCASEQNLQPTAFPAPSAGGVRGIDMAADSSDIAGELQGRRWLNFVARYYRDPSSRWPALTAAEAARLSALGLKIVTVWEWHSSDPAYFTYASGYSDAMSAYRQARAVGQPPGSAIYFAVDFNAHGPALYYIDQYFRGVNAGLAASGGGRSPYRVGVYGSGTVCTAVKGARLAQYAWLSGSTSWDGTLGYSAWNIKQAPAGQRFANLSFSHDANDATGDYGGFQLAEYAGALNPAGAVVTAAAQAPVAAATLVASAVNAAVPQAAAATMPPPPRNAPVAASVPIPVASAPVVAPVVAAAPARVAALSPPAPPPEAAPVAPPHEAPARQVAALEAASLAAAAVGAASRSARPASPAAAEVAALAAQEPEEKPAGRRATAGRERREKAEPARRELSREHSPTAHAAKALAAPRRRDYASATSNRAAARAPRNPGGSSHAELHQRGHRLSAPRRPEVHGAHLQAGGRRAVSLLYRSSRRSVE
jgi:hypothetical protein